MSPYSDIVYIYIDGNKCLCQINVYITMSGYWIYEEVPTTIQGHGPSADDILSPMRRVVLKFSYSSFF